jgi:hypothetical protein
MECRDYKGRTASAKLRFSDNALERRLKTNSLPATGGSTWRNSQKLRNPAHQKKYGAGLQVPLRSVLRSLPHKQKAPRLRGVTADCELRLFS